MSDLPAISIKNVGKTFKLPHNKQNSLKGTLINSFGSRKRDEVITVLDDVSFDIKPGDFFGITGRNGSGKSTLLKLIAGIYTPEEGFIEVNGKIAPFIELGVGFNPELTGRENVFLNGVLLGFTRDQIADMYEEIVEFAELERFMDQRLKNYSSGMQVRLAFSIAIRANSPILLLDEVLAVGDSNFQRKCFDYFANLKDEGRTVVFVSHDMDAVQRFCDRAALLDKGKVVKIGMPDEVTNEYFRRNEPTKATKTKKDTGSQVDEGTGAAKVKSMSFMKSGKKTDVYTDDDSEISLKAEIEAKEDIDEETLVGITLRRVGTGDVFWTNSDWVGADSGKMKKGDKKTIEIQIENVFSDGEYYATLAFRNKLRNTTFARAQDGAHMAVRRNGRNKWLLQPKAELKIK